jgi:uncharacterized protein YkwD
VVALAVTTAACVPDAPPGCPTSPPDALSSTILNRVNADRGAAGLGGLAWNARLACLASEWSAVMASNQSLTHRDLNATIRSPGYESYAGLAENIFVGHHGISGDAMHGAWMNSPHHRDNIMGPYDSMGFGWAESGDGRLWATQDFGRHF